MAGLEFLEKRNIFRLHLNESREGFCRRGRGRSFHVDGPKTEKARARSATCVVNHPLAWIKTGRESAQMKQNVQSPRLPALNTAKARLRALMQPCLEDKRERLVGERQRQKDRLTDRTRDRGKRD